MRTPRERFASASEQPSTETRPTRFQLKSHAPESLWQEHLGLYWLAHRPSLRPLRQITLGLVNHEIDEALVSSSSNAAQFIGEVYELDQGEAESLKEAVVAKVARQEPNGPPPSKLWMKLRFRIRGFAVP